MKKVITAIGNKNLNDILNQNKKYEVIGKDIQYKEGILEILNIKKDIDIIIVSAILEGEIEFKKLINNILEIKEDIEIIVFLDNEDIELRSFLFSKGISKIYLNNQMDIDTFIISLEDDVEEKTEKLKAEIKKLKEIIEKKEIYEKTKHAKIRVIAGAYGAGKSFICCLLCKKFAKEKKKTLIIDFDTKNDSIKIMYNILKPIKNSVLELDIIKINKYENIVSINDINIIEEIKENYDEILIDISSDYREKYIKEILNLANEIIYIVVPQISEMKKAFTLYEIYIKEFKINKNKIKILINKDNKFSVDSFIISNIFNEKQIISKIKYIENININKLSLKQIKINL